VASVRLDFRPRRGVVITFDAARGLGSLTEAGGGELTFHSTAIGDGSRSVEVGEAVVFVAKAAHLGRVEAAHLMRLGPGGDADVS